MLLGCLLTAILTYPTVRYFGSVGRFDTGDGRFSVWNVSWVAHALLHDPRHLLDANIFYPHRYALAFSELNLLAGVLATPVYAVTRNPIAAHNSTICIALIICFLPMSALVRRLTGSTWAGVVASTGYTFSAFTASHTAQIQLLMIFGFPLTMFAFHDVYATSRRTAGVRLGIALALTGLGCGYYGVYAGGLVGLAAVLFARGDRNYWFALVVAALVTTAAMGPLMLVYSRVRQAEGAVRQTTIQELEFYSATPIDFVRSGTIVQGKTLDAARAGLHAVAPAISLGRPTEVLFPGFVVMLLAAVGTIYGMASMSFTRLTVGYAIIAWFAAWASYGPHAGLYRVLMHVLPGISLLRVPARLGIVMIFALAVLAGIGLVPLLRRRAWVGPACVALLVAELWVPWPVQAWPADARAYQLLATLPRGGVVEFPFPYAELHEHTKAMMRSTQNWQPLLNGYSDHIPPDFHDLVVPVNGFPDRASFEILRTHKVRYVIIRVGEYAEPYRHILLNRFAAYQQHLQRLTTEGDVWLYEIVSWPE